MLISIIPAIMLISIMVSLLIFTPILLVDLIDGSFRISETVLWFGNVLAILFMAIGCLIFGILVDRLNPGIVLTFGSLFLAMQVALFFNHLRNGGEYGLIFFAPIWICFRYHWCNSFGCRATIPCQDSINKRQYHL